MKPAIFALSLALFAAPTLVSAQPITQADPQGAPQQGQRRDPQMHAQMRQMHAHMRQMHEQMRSQALSALSPANRQLLASLAGELAVSANPDSKAAAARLDRALSSNEKNAILQAHKNFVSQMMAFHEQMAQARGSMGGPGPDGQMGGPGPNGEMGGPHPQEGQAGMRGSHAQSRSHTAGQILLHLTEAGPGRR